MRGTVFFLWLAERLIAERAGIMTQSWKFSVYGNMDGRRDALHGRHVRPDLSRYPVAYRVAYRDAHEMVRRDVRRKRRRANGL